eukprot:1157553-Pelagomonas_calceolata.AAC.10
MNTVQHLLQMRQIGLGFRHTSIGVGWVVIPDHGLKGVPPGGIGNNALAPAQTTQTDTDTCLQALPPPHKRISKLAKVVITQPLLILPWNAHQYKCAPRTHKCKGRNRKQEISQSWMQVSWREGEHGARDTRQEARKK